jgi:spermidine synthase
MNRRLRAAICAMLFVSGLSALMYEVVWVRALGLIFGNTTHATATVLASFMAGLGVGSYFIGRRCDHWRHPLRTYGLLQIGIALYGVLTFAMLAVVQGAYVTVATTAGGGLALCTLARTALAFCVVFVPAFLMGGTMPVLAHAYVAGAASVGASISLLYAANTAGAVMGTLVAGFWAIPVVGMRMTVSIAAGLSLGVGVGAVVLGRRGPLAASDDTSGTTPPPVAAAGGKPWVAVCLGLSGVLAMVYEVGWTRALAAVLGSSTYAFTLMLATFLLGIAIGSALFARVLTKRRAVISDWVWLQLVLAASVLVVLPQFERVPLVMVRLFGLTAGNWVLMDLCRFTVCVAIMFLPTLCFGALFPVAASLYIPDRETVGRNLGRLYLCNTAGNIAGSLAAGFVLIPLIGIQRTLLAAAVAGILLGWGPALLRPFRPKRVVVATLLSALLGTLAFAQRGGWDARLISMGVHLRPQRWLGRPTTEIFGQLYDYDLQFYREGAHSIVSVFGSGDHLMLKVNGKTDASSSADIATQLLSGHIPHLLHKDPKRSLVIGLGSGMTLGASLVHDVEHVDSVELEPAVVEAAAWFDDLNRHASDDPRVRTIVNDGRNHLLLEKSRYDVIISEPSNPWMAGVASLFTVEFYELLQKRLTEGGILCQWLQAYGLHPDDFRMAVASVRHVFPHVTLWSTLPGDILIIAGRQPLVLNLDAAEERFDRMPLLRQDLAQFGIRSPGGLLAYTVLGEEGVNRFVAGAALNRDDRLPLEFSAPRSRNMTGLAQLNRRILDSFGGDVLLPVATRGPAVGERDDVLADIGFAYLGKEYENARSEARRYFKMALAVDGENALAKAGMAHCYAKEDKLDRAMEFLEGSLRRDPNLAVAWYRLGLVAWKTGDAYVADEALEAARLCAPGKIEYHLAHARMLENVRRPDDALSAYDESLRLGRAPLSAQFGRIRCLRRLERLDEAIEQIEELRTRHRTHDSVYEELCRVYDAAGELLPQIAAFEAIVGLNPYRGDYWMTLADLYERADLPERREWAIQQGREVHPYFDALLNLGDTGD